MASRKYERFRLIEKKCAKCGLIKPAEGYYPNRKKNALRSRCKVCCAEDRRAAASSHKEYMHKYYKIHKDEYVEYHKEYHQENKEKINSYVRAYHRNRKIVNTEQEIFSRTKSRAKKYNLPFDMTVEDIVIPEKCPVLGIDIIRGPNDGKKGPRPNSPSIDRIIPEKGYMRDNIRIISNRANTLKSNASITEINLVLEDLLKNGTIMEDIVKFTIIKGNGYLVNIYFFKANKAICFHLEQDIICFDQKIRPSNIATLSINLPANVPNIIGCVRSWLGCYYVPMFDEKCIVDLIQFISTIEGETKTPDPQPAADLDSAKKPN